MKKILFISIILLGVLSCDQTSEDYYDEGLTKINLQDYSGEIENDIVSHYRTTKDVFWSFKNLIETGDDPVFVFSELLRRKEEKNKEEN